MPVSFFLGHSVSPQAKFLCRQVSEVYEFQGLQKGPRYGTSASSLFLKMIPENCEGKGGHMISYKPEPSLDAISEVDLYCTRACDNLCSHNIAKLVCTRMVHTTRIAKLRYQLLIYSRYRKDCTNTKSFSSDFYCT